MPSRDDIVETLKRIRPYPVAEYRVKRVGLFGSYSHGQPTEASDVDVFVEFERPIGFKFVEFAEYLERLLGKKVDVLTPAGIRGIRMARVAMSISNSVVYV